MTALPPDEPVTVTVAICAFTLARWDQLTAAVASVRGQLQPGDDVIVVIDHNDTLLATAQSALASADTRVVPSAGPAGLSGARNTAVELCRGHVLAFLDDDAVAGDQWLPRIRAVFEASDHPRPVMAAGTAAMPQWPGGRRPPWFPAEYDWVVGCTYRGLPETTAEVRNVIGAAMAFRRDAFTHAGRFSLTVGRVGGGATGCEETELCIRLRAARPDARIIYLPDVSVAHTVSPDRARVRYFLRRCLGEGRSKAHVSRLAGTGPALASERDYLRRVLPRAVARELGRGVRGQAGGWLAAWLIVAGVAIAGLGYLHGSLRGTRLLRGTRSLAGSTGGAQS